MERLFNSNLEEKTWKIMKKISFLKILIISIVFRHFVLEKQRKT